MKIRDKSSQFQLAILVLAASLAWGQENMAPAWEASIPGPIADGTPSPSVPKPPDIPCKVIASHTKQFYVKEAPEMPDLPAPEGVINVTMQMVEDPRLRNPPSPELSSHEPLPATTPDDPAVLAQMEELQKNYRGTDLVFLSAAVYDHSRTLVTVYLSGTRDGKVSAWSNVDFNHFSGFSIFRVNDGDGTVCDYGLLMGIGNEAVDNTDADRPQIPNLSNLSESGPSFSLVEGDSQGEGMKILTQLHDLYKNEGVRMEAAFHAREKAHAERKAFLQANPPRPKDIVIRFMERAPSKAK